MKQKGNLFIFICLVVGTAQGTQDGQSERHPRRIMNYVKHPSKYQDGASSKLCNVNNINGACVTNAECDINGGRFVGYCQGQDVCCQVSKTCGGTTSSGAAVFQNPSFPSKDSDARICPFTMKINRGVCAARVDFKVFELARYEDGLCIRDTLTILGSTGGVATPVCGNMTNYATSFEVTEYSEVVLAMVLQGAPAHRFSIEVTQLPCNQILEFQSPTYSGIRNDDSVPYTPTTTTTTTTEAPTTTEAATNTEEVPTTAPSEGSNEEDEEKKTTTFLPPVRSNQITDDDVVPAVTESSADQPTTLQTGKIKIRKTSEVVIKSGLDNNEAEETSSSEGVYLETFTKVSTISAFSKAYNSLFNTSDNCSFEYQPKVADYVKDNNLAQFRVIGGEYTNLNEYPWQVALVYKKKFFCGGSLISDRHILTAAHCIFGSFSKGLDDLRVSLGDMDLTTKKETDNKVLRVKRVFWHLNYSPHTTSNDIGLFELETPVNFTYGISAVRLPTDLDDDFEDVDATVTGWGRYSSTKKATSTILKEYTGPLTPIEHCVKKWKQFPGIDARKEMHICLGIKMGTPCHGDSGGPLVVCTGPQCTQVGVVSFGFPLCTNVGLPAVFTRVTSYKRWIDVSLSPLIYY